MAKRNRLYFTEGLMLLALMLLAGCQATVSPIAESSVTPYRATQTQPPTHKPTATPLSTTRPEATKTMTPDSTPTWTPPPTLSAAEAEKRVLELLTHNAGCQLPCWWGTTPGETPLSIARQFLSSLATKVYNATPFPVERNGAIYLADGIGIDYRLTGKFSDGSVDYNSANGVVDSIIVSPRGTELSYQLHHLLTTYGEPERVLFGADTDYNQFSILLYYPKRGITAYYQGEFIRLSETYRVCPQGIGPELWLWAPGKVVTVADEPLVGPETVRLMRPINEVTNLDLDTFYQTYRDSNTVCFESPRTFWELP